MDWEKVSLKTTLIGHTDCVESVDFSNDSKLLLSASSDMSIRLWDWRENKEIRKLIGHDGVVSSAYFGTVQNSTGGVYFLVYDISFYPSYSA